MCQVLDSAFTASLGHRLGRLSAALTLYVFYNLGVVNYADTRNRV